MTWRGRLNPSAPMMRSSRPNSATNCRSSSVPCATCTCASPATMPTVWILRSYWSDQTNGTGANGSPCSPASKRLAAWTPCSVAFVQCSSRITWPSNSGLGQRATSPAATTPGAASTGRVADDAVVEREPAAFEPAGLGDDADTDDDEIRVERRAVAEADALDAAVAVDALHVRVGAQVDAVVAVHRRDDVAERGTEPAHHRVRKALEDRDVEARAAGTSPRPRPR